MITLKTPVYLPTRDCSQIQLRDQEDPMFLVTIIYAMSYLASPVNIIVSLVNIWPEIILSIQAINQVWLIFFSASRILLKISKSSGMANQWYHWIHFKCFFSKKRIVYLMFYLFGSNLQQPYSRNWLTYYKLENLKQGKYFPWTAITLFLSGSVHWTCSVFMSDMLWSLRLFLSFLPHLTELIM